MLFGSVFSLGVGGLGWLGGVVFGIKLVINVYYGGKGRFVC